MLWLIITSPIVGVTLDPLITIEEVVEPSVIAVEVAPIKRIAVFNLISAKVNVPPRFTTFPPIVILEFANFSLVTALLTIFAVLTILSAKVVDTVQPA